MAVPYFHDAGVIDIEYTIPKNMFYENVAIKYIILENWVLVILL